MRAIVSALIFNILVIGGIEYGFRYTGGMPSIIPGKTPFELQWKIQRANAERVVYVVGDSRVDYGFGDRLFTRKFNELNGDDTVAVNSGLSAGSVRKITEFIIENHRAEKAGVLIINFSPASFYHFNTSPGKPLSKIKSQDFFDHRIANYLLEKLFTYGRGGASLYRHFQHYMHHGYTLSFGWFSRTLFPEGFVNAKRGYNVGTILPPDIGYYAGLFNKIVANPDYYFVQKEKTIQIIKEAKMLGWDVIFIRLPIGEEMRKIEDLLPSELAPEQIAARLNVSFIDYDSDPRTKDLPTDESHLVPDSARTMSLILAQDLSKLFKSGFEGKSEIHKPDPVKDKDKIIIRRPTINDNINLFSVISSSIEKLSETPFYNEDLLETWMESIAIRDYTQFADREVFVAEIQEMIVGFGQIDFKKGIINFLHIFTPVLADETRSKVLNALEESAIRHNITSIQLHATLDSLSYFKHEGYKKDKIATLKFRNNRELKYVVMKKILS